MKKTKEVEKLQFVERMRYKKHIRIINKAGGFITRLSAVFYASKGDFKGTFATRIIMVELYHFLRCNKFMELWLFLKA